jgi:hypothetical protein
MRKGIPNQQYVTLEKAFSHFNRELFGGELPPVLITLHRHPRAQGYYSAEKFVARDDPERTTDELALNPATFEGNTDTWILSVLVHEMVHHWQQHFGAPSRRGYHNREWAVHMDEAGLVPSDTGLPGGKRTGQRVAHYVEEGGPFATACARLLAGGARVDWQSRPDCNHTHGWPSKVKYTCPECGLNAWAKPEAHLHCGDCGIRMPPQDQGTGNAAGAP